MDFKNIRHIWAETVAWPWYPFALSVYPILALLSANAGQVPPFAAVRPLLISLLFGIILYMLTWLFLRQKHKAAFLTTLMLALFFTYGHVYMALAKQFPDSMYDYWLPALWGILFIGAIYWTLRPKLTFISTAPSLNAVSSVLLLMSLWNTASVISPREVHALGIPSAPVQNDLIIPVNPPDVYYIILDSYARADLLQRSYGFDNTPFLSELEKRGFYIASCSQSNYVRTELSLGSSLNMQYLQDLSDIFTPESTARRLLWSALKHNAVRYNFESMGYETVTFETGFDWLNITDTDRYLSPPPASSGMTDFEALFMRTTLARYADDFGWVNPDELLGITTRNRFNFVFESVEEISSMPQPTFTYLHLVSPHPPFVFDAQGQPVNPAAYWNDKGLYTATMYQKGYVGQMQHLNHTLLDTIDTILVNSETPPVIILQGDHGPWLQPKNNRFSNLTALYFPDRSDVLYSSLSPVNIFRLVFNEYFGGNYDILSDVSYFSPVPNLYDFSEVPYLCGQ